MKSLDAVVALLLDLLSLLRRNVVFLCINLVVIGSNAVAAFVLSRLRRGQTRTKASSHCVQKKESNSVPEYLCRKVSVGCIPDNAKVLKCRRNTPERRAGRQNDVEENNDPADETLYAVASLSSFSDFPDAKLEDFSSTTFPIATKKVKGRKRRASGFDARTLEKCPVCRRDTETHPQPGAGKKCGKRKLRKTLTRVRKQVRKMRSKTSVLPKNPLRPLNVVWPKGEPGRPSPTSPTSSATRRRMQFVRRRVKGGGVKRESNKGLLLPDASASDTSHKLQESWSETSLATRQDSWIWFTTGHSPSLETFSSRQQKFQSEDPRVAELAAEIHRQEKMNQAIRLQAQSLRPKLPPKEGGKADPEGSKTTQNLDPETYTVFPGENETNNVINRSSLLEKDTPTAPRVPSFCADANVIGDAIPVKRLTRQQTFLSQEGTSLMEKYKKYDKLSKLKEHATKARLSSIPSPRVLSNKSCLPNEQSIFTNTSPNHVLGNDTVEAPLSLSSLQSQNSPGCLKRAIINNTYRPPLDKRRVLSETEANLEGGQRHPCVPLLQTSADGAYVTISVPLGDFHDVIPSGSVSHGSGIPGTLSYEFSEQKFGEAQKQIGMEVAKTIRGLLFDADISSSLSLSKNSRNKRQSQKDPMAPSSDEACETIGEAEANATIPAVKLRQPTSPSIKSPNSKSPKWLQSSKSSNTPPSPRHNTNKEPSEKNYSAEKASSSSYSHVSTPQYRSRNNIFSKEYYLGRKLNKNKVVESRSTVSSPDKGFSCNNQRSKNLGDGSDMKTWNALVRPRSEFRIRWVDMWGDERRSDDDDEVCSYSYSFLSNESRNNRSRNRNKSCANRMRAPAGGKRSGQWDSCCNAKTKMSGISQSISSTAKRATTASSSSGERKGPIESKSEVDVTSGHGVKEDVNLAADRGDKALRDDEQAATGSPTDIIMDQTALLDDQRLSPADSDNNTNMPYTYQWYDDIPSTSADSSHGNSFTYAL